MRGEVSVLEGRDRARASKVDEQCVRTRMVCVDGGRRRENHKRRKGRGAGGGGGGQGETKADTDLSLCSLV